MPTVAESLVKTLAAAGVKRIYGIVGDSLNGITDEIRRQKTIEWVHVRHEEVAAFAAGADAHVTGELAVCAGSCGPGNLHLINGLYDCHRSGVPVLAIAAQIPSALETAMTHAIGLCGVAVIVLPGDVALEAAENLSAPAYQKPVPPRV